MKLHVRVGVNQTATCLTWLRAYRAPFKVPEYCLGAIGWAKGFAEGAHRFEPADAPTARALSRKPALAIWEMADETFQPEHFIPLCRVAGVRLRLGLTGSLSFRRRRPGQRADAWSPCRKRQHVQRVKSQFDIRLLIDGRRSSVSSYRIPVPPPENVTFGTQMSRRTSLNPSFL